MTMVLAERLLSEDGRTQIPWCLVSRHIVIAVGVLVPLPVPCIRYHRPHAHDSVLPTSREISPISAELERPDRILRSGGSRLRRRIRPSSRRTLLVRPRPQLLRQKHAVKLLGLLELGAHLYVGRGLRNLGTEAEVVDIELGVHTLWSRIVGLGAIVACSVGGAFLFVASNKAAEERYFPAVLVSL
jgi:hypothetical protein